MGRFLLILGKWIRVPRLVYNSKWLNLRGIYRIDCGNFILQLRRPLRGEKIALNDRATPIPKNLYR